jgi:oligosaccharide repeat unit polymerase
LAIFLVAGGNIANNDQIGGLYTLVQIHIFYSSIFTISLFYLTNSMQQKIVYITSLIYIILIFVNGVRSTALELLFIYFFYFILNNKINYKHFILGFLSFIFLNLMADFRQGKSLSDLYSESDGVFDFIFSYFYFEYVLVMINIEAESLAAYNLFEDNNFLYGFTLFGAFFGSVPFYSLIGLNDIVFYFMNPALDIAYEWLPDLKGSVGLGSALPGEFYMNFGFFGSFLFIPIGFLLNQLYKGFFILKDFKGRIFFSVLYPLILVKAMLLLRNGFATSVKGFVYLYLIIFVILIISNIKVYNFEK